MSEEISALLTDLGVLSEKCSRDIKNNLSMNARLYLDEFDRILAAAKTIQPDKVGDIPSVSYKHYGFPNDSANNMARLYEVDAATSKLLQRLNQTASSRNKEEALVTLERLFLRFHRVARQLRDRRQGRHTLDVNGEYDVQDLLRSLLAIYFDDVRPEEWTPTYAGSAARMDFLLKDEKVVIETKKVSHSVRDREIGNQLIEDIARYGEHPDCKALVCFVYDPEGLIGNPVGLEKDLGKRTTERLAVNVYVAPK